jgi:tetratricopeptide (TPR) repeat protein
LGDARSLPALFTPAYFGTFLEHSYVPLPSLLFWINARLFGPNPVPLRVLAWAAASASAFLVGFAGQAMLGPWGWAAAVLYVVHPLALGTLFGRVHWLRDHLVALFLLAGLCAHLVDKSRKRGWLLAALYALALASKETGVMLPGILLAWDVLVEAPADWERRIRPYLWLAGVFLLYAFFRLGVLHVWSGALWGYDPRVSAGWTLRWLAKLAAEVVGAEFGPFRVLAALTSLAALTIALRYRPRPALFCVAWVALGLLPLSGLLPLRPLSSYVADGIPVSRVVTDWLLSVSPGACWLAALAFKETAGRRRLPWVLVPSAWALACLSQGLYLRTASCELVTPFGVVDPRSQSPVDGHTAVSEVGKALLELPALRERDPRMFKTYRSALDRILGSNAKELESYAEGALSSRCRMAHAFACLDTSNYLGRLEECRKAGLAFEKGCRELREGNADEAARSLGEAAEKGTVPSGAYGELAALNWRAGRVEEAFNAAHLASDDSHDGFWLNEACGCDEGVPAGLTERARQAEEQDLHAVAEFQLGHAERAAQLMERSIELDPTRARSLLRLGAIQESLGLRPEAARAYERAATRRNLLSDAEAGWLEGFRARGRARTPLFQKAVLERDEGIRAFEAGDRLGAVRRLERAVRLDPGDAAAWLSLGVARNSVGDRTGAQECYEKALRAREERLKLESVLGLAPREPDGLKAAILSTQADGRL